MLQSNGYKLDNNDDSESDLSDEDDEEIDIDDDDEDVNETNENIFNKNRMTTDSPNCEISIQKIIESK